jgi:DNA-directed RNA polymerase specialized sigma24 family protein
MNQIREEATVCEDTVFKTVYLSYFALLRNFLIFKFGNVQRAEDTAQNAFVILWENCQKCNGRKSKELFVYNCHEASVESVEARQSGCKI